MIYNKMEEENKKYEDKKIELKSNIEQLEKDIKDYEDKKMN